MYACMSVGGHVRGGDLACMCNDRLSLPASFFLLDTLCICLLQQKEEKEEGGRAVIVCGTNAVACLPGGRKKRTHATNVACCIPSICIIILLCLGLETTLLPGPCLYDLLGLVETVLPVPGSVRTAPSNPYACNHACLPETQCLCPF